MDAVPWSKGEVIPVHATKACEEAEEFRHVFLTSAEGGARGRSVSSVCLSLFIFNVIGGNLTKYECKNRYRL
jgi:hypothetical protein